MVVGVYWVLYERATATVVSASCSALVQNFLCIFHSLNTHPNLLPLLSEEELYDINIPLNLTVGKSSRHSTAAV